MHLLAQSYIYANQLCVTIKDCSSCWENLNLSTNWIAAKIPYLLLDFQQFYITPQHPTLDWP